MSYHSPGSKIKLFTYTYTDNNNELINLFYIKNYQGRSLYHLLKPKAEAEINWYKKSRTQCFIYIDASVLLVTYFP